MSSEYTSDTTGSSQTLQCRDCGQDFVFTAGEQAFYASRGFTHPPTRFPYCRKARKAQERGGSYGGGGGGQSRASTRDVHGDLRQLRTRGTGSLPAPR